jgi:hypothetical protein
MRKWARVLLALGAVGAICVLYLLFFGYQTFSILEMRHYASKFPVMNKTPVALADLSISQTTGAKLSYFGYDFEVPWIDVDESNTKLMNNRVVIAFRSRNAIILSSTQPRDFINGVASTFSSSSEKLREGFGDEAVESDYSFKTLILDSTPRQITLSTPWRHCNTIGMLLMIKATMLPSPNLDLFSIQTDKFKGYQFGDPKIRPPTIVVELYSASGMLEFYFIQKEKGPALSITQGDLNRFVQSVHKEESSQVLRAK